MKKRNIALILSALVFAASTAFVGCSNKSEDSGASASLPDSSVGELTDASEEETQPDPQAPKETEPTEESASETASPAAEEPSSEPASQESAAEPATDENGAVVLDAESSSDSELIAAAQVLYEAACDTSWRYHVGCPYSLDYNSYTENELGWQYYLVTDEGVSSIADVEADYNKVFSESYANDLSEIYIEHDGSVYALDGERGADIYYTGSKVTGIAEKADGEIFFTVENYYSGDDMLGEGDFTKTAEFSAVISSDGSWRAGKFTLPY